MAVEWNIARTRCLLIRARSYERAEVGAGAGTVVGRPAGDRHEVRRTDRGEMLQLLGDRALVARDGDVAGTGRAFAVEDRSIDGDVAVAAQLLGRLRPARTL